MKKILASVLIAGLLCTSGARADSNDNTKYAIGGAVGGIGVFVLIKEVIYPWFSGRWEQDRIDRKRADALALCLRIDTDYPDEIAQKGALTKEQLTTIITGKFGNRECSCVLYDQQLEKDLASLQAVDIAILEAPGRDKLLSLIGVLKTVNREKNLKLSQKLVDERGKLRTLEREQAEFDAKLDLTDKLKDMTKDVQNVVNTQKNNRSWMEANFDRVHGETREIKDMIRQESLRHDIRR